jgi:Fe-S cluster assembly ATPase SufC
MVNGRIAESGDKDLAIRLEEEGYERFQREPAAA